MYLALIAYLVASSVFIRISSIHKVGYGLCVVAATAMPVLLLLRGRTITRRPALLAAAVFSASVVYLIPALVLPEGRTVLHVAVDFSTLLVPVGFLLTGAMVPSVFCRLFEPIWASAFVATAFLSPIIVQDPAATRFFEPPSLGVVAVVAAVATKGKTGWWRNGSAVMLALLVILSFASRSRTLSLMTLSVFVLAITANRAARVIAAVLLITGVLVMVGAPELGTLPSGTSGASGSIRQVLSQPLRPDIDSTLTRRVDESSWVAEDTGRRATIWMLLGNGHGAVFKPVDWGKKTNISADGYVHNIHVGPVMMWFRYGILGIATYVVLLVGSASLALRAWFGTGDAPAMVVRFGFGLGLLLFLGHFMMRNVVPDPVFSFFAAGTLAALLEDPSSSFRAELPLKDQAP